MEKININQLPETNVDWYSNGEWAEDVVLNRPIKQIAGIYNTFADQFNAAMTLNNGTVSFTKEPNLSLDASKIVSGVIDAARLPSYVDDVLEYANLAGFPGTGESGKIYVALDTNNTYRWSGSSYISISTSSIDASKIVSGVIDAARLPSTNIDASKIVSGVIDAARLPSYVKDILEFANLAGFPGTGESGKIYVALDTNNIYRWKGSGYVEIHSSSVDDITYVRKTANYTAVKNQKIIADTTGGAFTITLPATPVLGDTVVIADGGNWVNNNLTVSRNGSTICSVAEDMIMNIGGVTVQFTYDGTTWQAYAQAGVTGSSIKTFEFVATAGQTTFSGNDANNAAFSYIPGAIIASLNGVILRPGDDYTATTGNSFVLNVPATVNSELQVITFTTFYIENTYTKAEVYTKAETVALIPAAVTFSSSAENVAGTIENKAVDPLGIREAFNATGSAPVYACRAWVNFDGNNANIRASGNVSSITYLAGGVYRLNMATAMPDTSYSISGSAGFGSVYDSALNPLSVTYDSYGNRGISQESRTTTSIKCICVSYASLYSAENINLSVYR